MNTTCSLLIVALMPLTMAAGEFINLDFEQANTNNMLAIDGQGGYGGGTEDLLPGWALAAGDTFLPGVGYNLFPLNETATTVISPDNLYARYMPVLGSYALALMPSSRPYHLTQAGEIPTDALSIEFAFVGGLWGLKANGTDIPLTYGPYTGAVGGQSDPRFAMARGDISAFAGTATELVLTTMEAPWADYNVIDNVAFSSRAIPEPSTWALLGLGGLGLWWARRRCR